jgi:hypothetical protein
MKDYTCLPPGDDVGGADLPQSNASFTGGSGDSVPSLADLKRGYSQALDDPMGVGFNGERLNILFPEPGFGGFCGRPNGWER